MKTLKSILYFFSITMMLSCGKKNKSLPVKEQAKTIVQKVDDIAKQLQSEITGFKEVVIIDHHRMAETVGVYTPASVAIIFSDHTVNTELIQKNQLIGLDLPLKILSYTEPDTTKVSLAYTSADFIQKRHQLDPLDLANYSSNMMDLIDKFPKEMISKTDTSIVEEGFGIVNIRSDFDFTTTIKNLKDIVMSQGDTKWFADIDFQKEASESGIKVRPTTLLFFGAPAPGGKAMITSPKIGLDAFCQKLLVYEKENGEVWIAYNDIVAFANLYYQTSTKPQLLINKRLKMTFSKAITLQEAV